MPVDTCQYKSEAYTESLVETFSEWFLGAEVLKNKVIDS